MTTPLTITKNDLDIFAVLQEFPCLSLPFIAELLGKTPCVYPRPDGRVIVRYQYLRARLTVLREAGYLEVVEPVRPHVGQKNRHNVYALTAKARKLLPNEPLRMRRTNNPHHDLGSCFIAASFKLGVIADERLTYITPLEVLSHEYCPVVTREADHPFTIPVRYWHGKYIKTTKRHDWRPFGISYGGKKLLFAGIEFDRDNEGNESEDPERSSVEHHLRTILALLDTGYKKHFGTAKFFVPIVTTGPIERWISTLNKLTESKGAERILFRHLSDWETAEVFPPATGHMLTGEWHRAGHPPLDLMELLGAKPAVSNFEHAG